jgi:hypothetical protein
MISPLGSRTREVYRLYREDEFIHAEEIVCVGGPGASMASSGEVGRERHVHVPVEQRLRRLAGMAMLAGALGAVGWLVAASSVRLVRGSGPRRLGVRSPALADRGVIANHPTRVRRTGATTYRRRAVHLPQHSSRRRGRRVKSVPLVAAKALPVSPPTARLVAKQAEFGFERGAGT